ncbi:hypothetical protein BAUCODRAFT_514583 [Baudoinia panamericana UAMH 10762]|uniref:Major royal jelly protein n=1 Tax=Baudoinia panamericana (strain UAMH 10762) TaxID=717646 RepID=M2NA94_BAUPA|nr:uncharacterized protein BAUCODRAFT_514583 [Baudoinia panamericana UAMH 10762]EMC96044.1 hypothetical protein BAUCODRAFT_514583 [Baudoinia panamericana UAMH 10762]
MRTYILAAAAANILLCSAQNSAQLIRDPGVYGPPLELVHLYYDQFPTGIAVSSTGRLFSNYPGGLDPNNTNNGSNGRYTIAELTGNTTESAYPSVAINSPPGGAINYTTYPPSGAGYSNYFIGSQSIVIDAANRAWILDTGRVETPNGTLVPASYGGPKLVGIHLNNNTIFQTIVFPTTVAFSDSYLNDVRFDLRPNITASGKGVAYITDSSVEGRNGIITVDLGTGQSWRHLDGNMAVRPESQWLAYLWGVPLYSFNPGRPFGYSTFGADGIALSADGATLYWKSVAGRYLYSIPTARLRDNSATSEVLAQAAINNHGQTGITDGMETDMNNGFIYHGNMEQNAISFYNPANGTDSLFVRDPRINWVRIQRDTVDTMSVSTNGYLYFTCNQLAFGTGFYPGTDRRQKPFALFRVKLPNNGTKVILT